MTARFAPASLHQFCDTALAAAGIPSPLRKDMSEILLMGDLLGHDTHGLALLPMYLDLIAKGVTARDGSYQVVESRKASALWDGQRLPGAWLVNRAIEAALEMAAHCGTGTVVIRRSQHIGCLAAYLSRATALGHVILLASTDPSVASVAAYGGRTAVFTPNPIAAGFPTEGDPVMIDISASLTTNGMTRRLHSLGQELPHAWLQDAQGYPAKDPGVLFAEPAGTILPLGGLDAGHKGFGLLLLIEMLTGGLAGFGRADPAEGPGATVFVQLIDPKAFAGADAFKRQMQFLADRCRASDPAPGFGAVRLPGEGGLRRLRDQTTNGVALRDEIVAALRTCAQRLSVPMPDQLPLPV